MDKQKVLIIGAGGGREHALGWRIAKSKRVEKIFFAPGNAGTKQIGVNLDMKATNVFQLLIYAKQEKIDLVLVVSDEPLAMGVSDEFRANGFRVWGPTKAASQIEASKAFSKNFMQKHGLPTARFEIFDDFEKAKEYLKNKPLPVVIKADGLAFGKGVVICQTTEEAEETLKNIMVQKVFGDSGSKVVIEEFLVGPEISIHAISDGKNYKIFPPSQDHKKIGEGDTGLNTGGMGAVCPLPFIDKKVMDKIEKEIIAPTIKAMADDGMPFEGILYPSLMLTSEGPKIIEFNARFGDPECQVYMRLLDMDIMDIFDSCLEGRLDSIEILWKHLYACNVVLASGGYPGAYEKDKIVSGISKAEEDENVVVFHSGTTIKEGSVNTNGGRVLGVSVTSYTLQEALERAYKAIDKISFEGMQYRRDIGTKALKLDKVNYPEKI